MFIYLFIQVEYDEFNSVSVLGTGGDPLVIPLPNVEIPLQVLCLNLLGIVEITDWFIWHFLNKEDKRQGQEWKSFIYETNF